MGCTLSKPEDLPPATGREMLATPRMSFGDTENGDGTETKWALDILSQVLSHIDDYITKKRVKIKVTGIGGALNMMLLRARLTMQAVDFLNVDLSKKQADTLSKAMSYADHRIREDYKVRLPSEWFNNRNVLSISPEVRRILMAEAESQDNVVYSSKYLTIYTVPWEYSFSAQLDRVSGESPPTSDLLDAAKYLNRYLIKTGQDSVKRSTLYDWSRNYQLSIDNGVIESMNQTYREIFGHTVIV